MGDKKSVRKNFRIPAELAEGIEKYAKEKNTNMTRLIVDYFTFLLEQDKKNKSKA